MSDPKKAAEVMVLQWPGMISNADAHDIPEGAAVFQENCTSFKQGELQVRKGLLPVLWDN